MNNPSRILIAEEDAGLVESLQGTLTQMGCAVVGLAASGSAALELALAQKPDAILMDIHLCGPMSGIQAAEQIQAQLNIPIIYLTAPSDEVLLQQAKVTDAHACLVKPVSERELRASLEMALYKHAAEQRLKHLNQVLRAVRDVNRLIAREQDVQSLLDEACKILLRMHAYPFVWIGQPAGDMLKPVSQAGDDQSLLQTILASATPEQGRKLPGSEVSRSRQKLVCADMLNDERYAPWKKEIQKAGFRSSVAMPMLSAGVLYGMLVVYADQPDSFDEEEVDSLSELAQDIARGLKAIAVQVERNQAEQQLQLLKHSIDSALDGVYWMDSDGHILYVNDAGCKALGYSREELLQMRVFDINLRATAERWAQVWQNVREQKNSTVQSVHRRKDGSEFPVELTSTYSKLGEREYLSGFAKDITERVHAEERNQQSEKKYRDLFQVNKDGISIFILSPDPTKLRFVEINDAAHLMLGFSREEMLQLSPSALELGVTQEAVRLRQVEFDSKGVANFETMLAHKDGHAIYAEFTSQLIQYEGQPAIMNIVHEITERKQRERELHAIATLSAALRTAPSRARMLPVIVAQMVSLLKADAATVEIVEAQTGDVITEAADGLWINLLGSRQAKGTGINAIISATLKPYYTHDLENDPNLFYHEWAREGIRGSAGVPLIAQEKLIGFIWIGRKTDFAEPEVQLLCAIADIAANAIQRATLYELTLRDAADLELAYDTTLEGWAHALELRDQETEGHTRRVVQTTFLLARAMGFGEAEIEHIRRGALLHDIGKMGIPDSILLKPGKLSESEWVTMRRHPLYAYEFLEAIDFLKPALHIPYCHHEKWDGTGYPRGLRGAQIPLAARIFAIVDVWDALTTDRPYRPAWSVQEALAYIREQDGLHFDPKIVEIFMRLIGDAPQ